MAPYQTGLVVLAAAAIVSASPAPAVTPAAELAQAVHIPAHAPHTANHAPAYNPLPLIDEDVGEVCIQFTSDNPNWSFTNQPPWGTNSGTFGSLGGQMCVPTSNSAAGAMFIGPDANPGPGSTKLECYFPTSGEANCDVSLVDGYSLSVTCTAENQVIGGGVDLWSDGQPCLDTSAQNQGICKNDLGYAATQDDVSAFFQPAVNNGNQYCIWVDCGQDYYFAVTSTLSCHISGTDAS